MPTNKEIASWLREAADTYQLLREDAEKYGSKRTVDHYIAKDQLFRERAAQVEQGGRCESCRWWLRDECTKSGLMSKESSDYMTGFECGPQFGCIHWKEKK